MRVSLVLARAENGVIGRDNDLPWHLPGDLRYFRQLTTGHSIVVGRKTFESIGKPLPNRRSIVVSRNPTYSASGAEVVASLEDALDLTCGEDEVFVIGGAEIFGAALPLAHRLYVTAVHAQPEGDVFLPDIASGAWELVKSERHEADERNAVAFTFEVYDRKEPG